MTKLQELAAKIAAPAPIPAIKGESKQAKLAAREASIDKQARKPSKAKGGGLKLGTTVEQAIAKPPHKRTAAEHLAIATAKQQITTPTPSTDKVKKTQQAIDKVVIAANKALLDDGKQKRSLTSQSKVLDAIISPRGVTSPAPKQADADLAAKIAAAPQPLPKGTIISGVDCSGMTDDPKLTGIPVFLQAQNKKALTPSQLKTVAKIKQQADEQREKDRAKSATSFKKQKPVKAAKAKKAVEPKGKPRKSSDERARYDWHGAREAAENGKIPAAPDFSANTHRYYRPMLAEVEKLVKARDLAALQAYRVKGTCSSPSAIKRYREIAIVALKAKKA